MQCAQCQTENPPQAKFCLECATPLLRRCVNCGTQLPAAAKFCPECARPVSAPTPTQSRFTTPESYTPKHLAEKILTSKSALEGERKQVTVLFADLKGSMELLADRDPEEARKLLDPVLEHMMEAVHRYEGTVNQVMGDGIMALFGAPLAHEDHAVRACYAALRMQESIKRYAEGVRREHGVTVSIRVGLNSGEVVVRAIGSDLHMDYTAVGQTTHLAARMEQLAQPGSSLLSPATLKLVEGYVEVKPLGPMPVKGLPDPVEGYELLTAASAHSRIQAVAARGLTRFVGRDEEMQQLGRALSQARTGRGQVIAVVGEPGVGKSRLFWEFIRSDQTDGCLILESRSVSYGKATPYAPVIDILKLYFQIEIRDDPQKIADKVTAKLLTLGPAFEPALSPLLSLLDAPVSDLHWHDLDPLQRRDQTFEAVKQLLLRESQVRPVCLVFEDLHWVDSETEGFLGRLIDSLPAARVLLLVNYRTEYHHPWGSKSYYSQIRIDPMPPASVAEFLWILLGDDPGLDAVKQSLIARTDGNPFFLEENVRTLIETGALDGERGYYRLSKPLGSIQVPATVQAVIAARIDRLPPEEKQVLQAAAVIGKDVLFPLLNAIAEVPPETLYASLKDLQAAEFLFETLIFPEQAYTFKHALTHEVAYQSLLHDRRKALHAKVLDAIERLYRDRLGEHADALARHALRGEVWDKAVDFLREAGAKAFTRAAFSEAVERYEQALDIIPKLPTTSDNIRRAIDVRLDLHIPLYTLGQVSRLVRLHEEAEHLALQLDDRPRLGRVIMRMAVYSFFNAEYVRGIDYARRALDIAAATDDIELHILASHAMGVNHFWLGEYTAAAGCFARIVDGPHVQLAKRRLGLAFGSPYLLGCCFLAWCFALLGDFARGLEYGRLAVGTAETSGQPQAQAAAYAYYAVTLALKGEFPEALGWAERAAGICETKQILAWLPTTYLARGWARAWSGRMADGLTDLEQGVTMSEGLGVKVSLSQYYLRWAQALLLAEKVSEARRLAEKALDLARATNERGTEAEAYLLLGEIAAAEDSPRLEPALSSYLHATALADELGIRPISARCHLALGQLRRWSGDQGAAEVELALAARLFREMDMQFWLMKAEEGLRVN
jgi:predicted ATPase/class 3 adenylate cyclase